MPGFNKTGPEGQGPMTGRRMGRCTNYGAALKKQAEGEPSTPEQDLNDEGWGRGFGFRRGFRGRGRGRGMGWQNRFRGGM